MYSTQTGSITTTGVETSHRVGLKSLEVTLSRNRMNHQVIRITTCPHLVQYKVDTQMIQASTCYQVDTQLKLTEIVSNVCWIY